ncbi:MAG: hypothetical protein OR995_09445, partial [Candidatus Nanopelagicales bacterium]|nr:hypothetical protein [Candidatus Nanopelagicales bacterium]
SSSAERYRLMSTKPGALPWIVTQNGESRSTIIADMRNPRVATTTDGQKYFTARVRTETQKGTTQIAKSDGPLARHATNPTSTPIPNILGPTSIFIDGSSTIAAQFVDPGLATFSTPEFIAGWENNLSTKLGSVPIVTD